MSPEQARGEKVDHRTDLFSLGAVMYRLCANRLPFDGPTTMSVLMALGTEEPTPVQELNPNVPDALAALIHQLLAKRPDARPQSAAEVVKRLRAIAEARAVPQARPVEHATSSPARPAQTVSAPMQVTAPEQNPFAGLDASLPGRPAPVRRAAAPAAAPKPAQQGPAGRLPLALVGALVGALALAALVIGGVIIIIRNEDGTETRIEAPDGAKVTVKGKDGKTLAHVEPATQPPGVASDPERQAAEYALSLGGYVRLQGQDRDIKAPAELPKERFKIVRIGLNDTKVTDAGLARFKDCESVDYLDLARTAVTDAGLANFKDRKNLWFLNLPAVAVTDAGLAHFKDCKRLGHLNLHETKVTDAGAAAFKDCKNLGYLGLFGTKVTDAGLDGFENCKDLWFLGVRGCPVTRKRLEAFHAAVPGCKIDYDDGIIEPNAVPDVDRTAAEWALSLGGGVRVLGWDKDIRAVADLPKNKFTLKGISLDGPKVTDDTILRLKEFKELKGITQFDANNSAVTDAGLAHIAGFKQLDWLGLFGTRVTDAGLIHLKEFDRLGGLGLSGTQVTDAGLAHLKEVKGLGHLVLDATKITDAGVEHLREMNGLMHLYLSGTAVTDAGLARLQGLKGLDVLEVKKTRVTAKGLEAFHAALPRCRIDHDGGTIEPKK